MSQPCSHRAVRAHPSRWFYAMLLAVLAVGLLSVPAAVGERASSHARAAQAAYLDAGGEHTCAVLLGGSVRCWGANTGGRLGITSPVDRVVDPAFNGSVPVEGGRAQALASGLYHTCAIVGDGVVECWGFGQQGRLGTGGNGDVPNAGLATPVNLGGRATGITAGLSHTCAILEGGAVRCWGTGAAGRLGNGAEQDVSNPASVAPVDLGRPAIAVSAGDYHTCAILDTGAVRCWGFGDDGRLGDGSQTTRLTPSAALDLGGRRAQAISAGSGHTCAVADDGDILCWGFNVAGQLGIGTTTSVNVPTKVLADERAVAVAAAGGYLQTRRDENGEPVKDDQGRVVTDYQGGAHTCAIFESGSVRCWGFGPNGRLGDGQDRKAGTSNQNVLIPSTPVNTGPGVRARGITVGNAYSCALLSDDTVRCWGFNGDGRLGNGGVGGSVGHTPAEVPPASLGGRAPGSVAQMDLAASSAAGSVNVGQSTTVQLRVTNVSGDPASAQVSLSSDGGLAIGGAAPEGGAYAASERTWDTGTLSAGQSAVMSVTVTGAAAGSGSLVARIAGASAQDPRAGAVTIAQVPVTVAGPPPSTTDTTPEPPPVVNANSAKLTSTVARTPRAGLVSRVRVNGQLELPAGVPAAACAGVVRVRALAGKRAVVSRNVRLKGTATRCVYSTTLTLPAKRVRGVKRISVRAGFAGNGVVTARNAPARTVAVRMPPLPRRVTAAARRQSAAGGARLLRVTGEVRLPAGMPVTACTGRVNVRASDGGRVVSSRTATLRRVGTRCTYTALLPLTAQQVKGASRLVVRARFLGTGKLQARDSGGTAVRV